MAERNNATCSICGRPYYKCISCKDAMALSPWKALCCSAQHYQIHQVIKGQNSGVYTKDEAKSKLKNINISDIEINSFKPHIKKIVKDILKEDKVIVETTEKIKNTVVEDVTEVKVEETEIAESVIESIVSRKRNFKANNEIEEVE